MTKTELKKIEKHNEMLLQAKDRLMQKGFKDEAKKDIDLLLSFVRPENMTSGVFNAECDKVRQKYMNLSQSDSYDVYEKEIIKNTASKVYEIQFKAYLTVCFY